MKPSTGRLRLETALAEAEIEYNDKRSPSIYVKFPVENGKRRRTGTGCVCRHLDDDAVDDPGEHRHRLAPKIFVRFSGAGGEQLVMARELVEQVMAKAEISDYDIVRTWKGSELAGVVLPPPAVRPRKSTYFRRSRHPRSGSGWCTQPLDTGRKTLNWGRSTILAFLSGQ